MTRWPVILAPRWVKDPLWKAAKAVPSLDLNFARDKALSSLVTFTRASSGTYVDSQGVIRTATTNLQIWSEDFRNTADAGATRPWVYNTSAVTADNTAAPNGTSTADLIAGAAGTANKFLTNNISTTAIGFYTFSVYLKQGTEQFVVIRLSDGSANGIRGRFDLAAGTVVITNEGAATGQAASATAVGNGWYRCVVTCSVSSLPSSVIQPQLWLNNFASTSLTTNYFAWGAQLEQSSTVGEYIPTTSTINSAPRFDHNPTTGESLGLLVEESRTNSIRNNTMVGAVAGTPGTLPTNWSTSLGAGISREVVAISQINGITCLDFRLFGTTTNTNLALNLGLEPITGVASASGQAWTESIYLALIGGSLSGIANTRLYLSSTNGTSELAYFNLGDANLTSTLTRFSGTASPSTAGMTAVRPLLWVQHNGIGSVIDFTLRIGLPQLEQGAFATSGIPTSGTAATRSADVASISGSNFSSWYRADEGSLFTDCSINYTVPGTAFPLGASINDGTSNNRIENGFLTASLAGFEVTTSGVAQAAMYPNAGSTLTRRLTTSFRLNDFAASLNGGAVNTDTSGTVPAVDRLRIGDRTVGNNLNGTIRRLTYWPARLANSTLQAITQ